MKLYIALLSALATFACATPADNTIPPSDLAILATALPSSALAYIAESGRPAFSMRVASEFKAGHIPGWFTKLPTGVQSVIIHNTQPATTGTTTAISSSPSSASSSSAPSSTASAASGNTAAMPTAVAGVGIAGVVGLVGLLAL